MNVTLHTVCLFLMPSIVGISIVLITAALIAIVREKPWRNMLKLSGAESILAFLVDFNTQPHVTPMLGRLFCR